MLKKVSSSLTLVLSLSTAVNFSCGDVYGMDVEIPNQHTFQNKEEKKLISIERIREIFNYLNNKNKTINYINPKNGKHNCLDCAISFYNWINSQAALPDQVGKKHLKFNMKYGQMDKNHPNKGKNDLFFNQELNQDGSYKYIYFEGDKNFDTKDYYLVEHDHIHILTNDDDKEKINQKMFEIDLSGNDIITQTKNLDPIFNATIFNTQHNKTDQDTKYDYLKDYIDNIPINNENIPQDKQFRVGLLNLRRSDKLEKGHFLNFYTFYENGVRKSYIIDPQHGEILTADEFSNKYKNEYYKYAYVWYGPHENPFPFVKMEPTENRSSITSSSDSDDETTKKRSRSGSSDSDGQNMNKPENTKKQKVTNDNNNTEEVKSSDNSGLFIRNWKKMNTVIIPSNKGGMSNSFLQSGPRLVSNTNNLPNATNNSMIIDQPQLMVAEKPDFAQPQLQQQIIDPNPPKHPGILSMDQRKDLYERAIGGDEAAKKEFFSRSYWIGLTPSKYYPGLDANSLYDLKSLNINQLTAQDLLNIGMIHGFSKLAAELQEQLFKRAKNLEPVIGFDPMTGKNNANVIFILGWMHNRECGTPKDTNMGLIYYKMAADQGFAIAQNTYAFSLPKVNNKPTPDAISYFKMAADQGVAIAQYNYAGNLPQVNGKTTPEALKYLKSAADQGLSPAQHNYAITLPRVDNKPTPEALSYFKKAADQGPAAAQYNYARALTQVDGKRTEVLAYLNMAADQGFRDAKETLEKIRQRETAKVPSPNTQPNGMSGGLITLNNTGMNVYQNPSPQVPQLILQQPLLLQQSRMPQQLLLQQTPTSMTPQINTAPMQSVYQNFNSAQNTLGLIQSPLLQQIQKPQQQQQIMNPNPPRYPGNLSHEQRKALYERAIRGDEAAKKEFFSRVYWTGECCDDFYRDINPNTKFKLQPLDFNQSTGEDFLNIYTLYIFRNLNTFILEDLFIKAQEFLNISPFVFTPETKAGTLCFLGSMYYNGYGTQKDTVKGKQYVQQAADQGHALAQDYYATMLTQENIMNNITTDAMKYIKMAADQGLTTAKKNLERIKQQATPQVPSSNNQSNGMSGGLIGLNNTGMNVSQSSLMTPQNNTALMQPVSQNLHSGQNTLGPTQNQFQQQQQRILPQQLHQQQLQFQQQQQQMQQKPTAMGPQNNTSPAQSVSQNFNGGEITFFPIPKPFQQLIQGQNRQPGQQWTQDQVDEQVKKEVAIQVLQFKKILSEKDQTIKNLELSLDEKEEIIKDQGLSIKEKEQTIKEQEQSIAEKEQIILNQNQTILDKNKAFNDFTKSWHNY